MSGTETSMNKLAYAGEAVMIMKALKVSNCTTHICSADQSRPQSMILCSEVPERDTALCYTILRELIIYSREYLTKDCPCPCST